MKISLSDHFTYQKLLRFVAPSIFMMIITSIYSIVDGFFVSNFVGKNPFAALNLIFPVIMALAAFGFMIGTGGSALIAKTLGEGKPRRVQGCFISDEEVQAVVNAVKAQSQSDYSAEVMEQIERRAEQSGKPDSGAAAQDTGEGDELLPAAVDVILETGQASVSFLQRRLKLGYARAARIVDEMEERGIIGPYEGAKPRQLLITREQWEQMQNGTYAPPAPPVEDELP